MKLRMLPIAFASLLLVGCGAQGQSSASEPSGSSSALPTWRYLNFLSNEHNLRVDLFRFPEGLQISYGNTALSQAINDLTINENANFTINRNTEADVSLNAVIVKEDGNGRSIIETTLGIEGDKLLEYFSDVLKDELKTFNRSYIAFSIGDQAKWTKGLNDIMDADIENKIINK